MSAPQSDAFKQAVIDSKKLTSKPSNDDLLEFYAYFKVGTGEDFSSAAKPGMFDLKGKAKYNAWENVHKDGLSAKEAQDKYVELIEAAKNKYGFDANKQPEAVGSS
ncbi:acyl CoA binding protein [Truncatella angustata]|uniref:Acyl CoA binding protein n=1 Tax=Truncatella angustata TaxID=152316 RepID=A0A9P8UVK8_9PEZI|nr:acyl CoA binding protein [Truncatella angustata]KAH6659003.1 acyl CoA binding protein [Truncatella angustata]KAH8203195.1 hypothetical protein TruAng_002600 [Truncatella angustata]